MQNKKTIYTIGHSTQTVDEFIGRLRMNNIDCVVDVRSTPYSQYASQFNERDIKNALKNNGIQYIYMGKEFGARRENPDLYDEHGRLDFEKTIKDIDFIEGIKRIEKGLHNGFSIAFMCTEKDPQDCHRCILVARAVQDKLEAEVENILIDGSLRKQSEIEQDLIEKYFPNRSQISLFESDNMTEEEYIKEAYRRKGKEIAYQLEEQ